MKRFCKAWTYLPNLSLRSNCAPCFNRSSKHSTFLTLTKGNWSKLSRNLPNLISLWTIQHYMLAYKLTEGSHHRTKTWELPRELPCLGISTNNKALKRDLTNNKALKTYLLQAAAWSGVRSLPSIQLTLQPEREQDCFSGHILITASFAKMYISCLKIRYITFVITIM